MADPTPTPKPAVLIPDHDLIRPIGRGSYGEVWLARTVLGEYRAVKIVRRDSFDRDRPIQRELEGIQKYEPISRSHEHQVHILHVGRFPDGFYYVMELADHSSAECGVRSEEYGMRQEQGGVRSADDSIMHPAEFVNPETYTPKTLRREVQRRGRLPATGMTFLNCRPCCVTIRSGALSRN